MQNSKAESTRNRNQDRLQFEHDMTKDIDYRTQIHFRNFQPFGFRNSVSTLASSHNDNNNYNSVKDSINPHVAKMESASSRKLNFAFNQTSQLEPV